MALSTRYTARGWLQRLPRRVFGLEPAPCILMYHGVVPDGTRPALWTQVEATRFDAQMRHLAGHRPVVPLRKLIDARGRQTLDPASVAVTFDDGYQNNLEVALPILDRYGIPATIFVTAGLVGTDELLWTDQIYDRMVPVRDPGGRRRRAAYAFIRELKVLPDAERRRVLHARLEALGGVPGAGRRHPRRILDVDALKKLAATPGITIGSHGMTHALLTRLLPSQVMSELVRSKTALEAWVGASVDLVAYPDGASNAAVRQAAREAGYVAGLTTEFRRLTPDDDPFALGRYPVGSDLDLRGFIHLLSGRLEVRNRFRRRLDLLIHPFSARGP